MEPDHEFKVDSQGRKVINLEPNWEGMRTWLRNVYKTDPVNAEKIAAEMGKEAPDFSDLRRPYGLNRGEYNYGEDPVGNAEGQGNAMADAIDQYFRLGNQPEQQENDTEIVNSDLQWAVDFWRTHGTMREEI